MPAYAAPIVQPLAAAALIVAQRVRLVLALGSQFGESIRLHECCESALLG